MEKRNSAVIFGAGSVGRGFLGQLFSESGYEVVFVDVDEELVSALTEAKYYTLRLAGIEKTEDIRISPVRAVDGRSVDSVAEEVSKASIMATAVGARALQHIAGSIARGISLRVDAKAPPVNIILCENLHDAPEMLRRFVEEKLPARVKPLLDSQAGFVPAVIARMSPVPTPGQRAEDILRICAEPYKVLPVDRDAFAGTIPQIAGMKPVAPFTAYTDRKLYIHNASHAMLGFLGHLAGYQFGYEAVEDHSIKEQVLKALDEAGRALIAEHKFEPVAFQEHVDYLLLRYSNRALADPIDRLARDVLRKLAPGDRLVGAARLALKHGIRPEALARGIAAGFAYKNPDDPHAVELQVRLKTNGFEKTLAKVCGIAGDEELGQLVYSHYREICECRRGNEQ